MEQAKGPYGPVQHYPKGGDANAREESWISCQKMDPSRHDQNESDAYLPHPVYPPEIQTNVTEAWLSYPSKIYRAAYYAAMETVDEALGIVLNGMDELDPAVKNNTLLVVFSDQGFKLGEHRLWCIRCLFDADITTRVYFRDYSVPHALGKESSNLYDLVDLFPAVVSLATGGADRASGAGIEGVDHSDTVTGPVEGEAPRQYCFAQIPNCHERANLYRFENNVLPTPSWSNVNRTLPPDPGSHDGCNRRHRHNITNMGYTVRSKDFRCTAYLSFDGKSNASVNGTEYALRHPVSEELYDHRGFPSNSLFRSWPYRPSRIERNAYEESFVRCNKHRCENKFYAKIRDQMRQVLKSYIREGLPPA